MAENRISLINAGPRLNAGLDKKPRQNCRIVNKRRGRLIEKIRYLWNGQKPMVFDTYKLIENCVYFYISTKHS